MIFTWGRTEKWDRIWLCDGILQGWKECLSVVLAAEWTSSITQAAFLQSEIILYPNPAHDQFILETGTYFNQPASIVIFDAQGRMVMTDSWPAGEKRKQMAVENLENGVYLVVVETNAGRVMIKRILKV